MPPTDAPAAPKGTARRDLLLELQNKAQKKWAEKKAYEVDAPEGEWDGGKFMVTFPYPIVWSTFTKRLATVSSSGVNIWV